MKNFFQYQVSEYDCGPTCLINVLKFFVKSDQIKPRVIKKIYQNSMNSFGSTSKEAMEKLAFFLKDVFSLKVKKSNNILDLKKCLDQKGICIVRTKLFVDHYVLVVSYDKGYYELWDPYFMNNKDYQDEEIILLFDQDKINRKIKKKKI